ncbi:M20/M25/M40 family metallo-hydrolase [Actinoplanes sp. NPDC051513]|uniref:M20/M25/M40 family metallo-hydrolase n=1 Tax=Actinoplanes sp. NPDC051513 TaxID=3363908 RepID=UPI0037A30CC2
MSETRWAVLPAGRAAGARTRGARIGDEVIVWSREAEQLEGEAEELDGEAEQLEGEAEELDGEAEQLDGEAEQLDGEAERAGEGTARSELSLVTQVGRAFQQAHPRIPVILDHGRHLVIDGGKTLRQKEDTCWRVEPLLPGVTVVDRPARHPGRVDPIAAGLVAAVSRPPYEADTTWLAQLPTRHSTSAGFGQAADRAAAALDALGYATSRFPVTVGGGRSANVIAEKAASPDVVVVTAHLDSVNIAGGPAAAAPGADDNGSGSAGVLLLARLLAGLSWEHTLRLILFGGEEQGLFGSKQYVASLSPDERSRIRAVLNMDMIASRNGPQSAVLLEGAAVSQSLIDDLAAAAATYTGLRVETSLNPFASDHVPFIQAGVPAVLTIEGNDSANHHIHSADDLLDHLDYELAMEILRMNVATLAGWLRPAPGPAPRPAGPVVSWAPGRLDVFVTGADHGLYHKAWTESSTTEFERLGGLPGGS